jgi:hypothetical protein
MRRQEMSEIDPEREWKIRYWPAIGDFVRLRSMSFGRENFNSPIKAAAILSLTRLPNGNATSPKPSNTEFRR